MIDETRRRSRRNTKWYIQALRYIAGRIPEDANGIPGAILAFIENRLLNGLSDSVTAGWLANDIDREDAEGE